MIVITATMIVVNAVIWTTSLYQQLKLKVLRLKVSHREKIRMERKRKLN